MGNSQLTQDFTKSFADKAMAILNAPLKMGVDLSDIPVHLHPKVSEEFKNLQDKILKVNQVTFANDNLKWGIDVNDDSMIHDDSDPPHESKKILYDGNEYVNYCTITDGNADVGFHRFYYVFVNNFGGHLTDIFDPSKPEHKNVSKYIGALLKNKCMIRIVDSLRSATNACSLPRESGYPDDKPNSYECAAIKSVMRVITTRDVEPNEWAAALSFSYAKTLKELDECSTGQSVIAVCQGSMMPLSLLNDTCELSVPYIEWVGNVEDASMHGIKTKPIPLIRDQDELDNMIQTYGVAAEVNEDVELRAMSAQYEKLKKQQQIKDQLTRGCTILLSLTMNRLQKMTGASIMTLHNAGGIPGCKCYTTAALVCGMLTISMASGSLTSTQETINHILLGEDDSELQSFDDPRCTEKKQRKSLYRDKFAAEKTEEHIKNLYQYYVMISIPTAGDMFRFAKEYAGALRAEIMTQNDLDLDAKRNAHLKTGKRMSSQSSPLVKTQTLKRYRGGSGGGGGGGGGSGDNDQILKPTNTHRDETGKRDSKVQFTSRGDKSTMVRSVSGRSASRDDSLKDLLLSFK